MASMRDVKVIALADEQTVRLHQDAGTRGKMVDEQIVEIPVGEVSHVISMLFAAAVCLGLNTDYPPPIPVAVKLN